MSRQGSSSGVVRGLLSETDAAVWLGVGTTTLRSLGIQRRKLGHRKLYDVRDLEAYRDELPYENDGIRTEVDECDAVYASEA